MRSGGAAPGAIVRRAAAQNGFALATGALLAFAFAPANLWPLAVLCPAALMWLWEGKPPRRAAALGFWFGFGTFAAGTYWLYVSIHVFGQAPTWMAVGLMLGLVAIMGAYHAALGYVAARWLPPEGARRWLLGVPAAWLLMEWWRGWFLSGFSWLSLGYSQTDTWLARLAPVGGVYLLSFALLLGSGALLTLVRGRGNERRLALAVLALPWLAAAALGRIEWTRPAGAPLSVAIVQGAIPQDLKWIDSNLQHTLDLYERLTREALGTGLVLLPESALPELAHNLADYLARLYREAHARGSSVMLGLVRAEEMDGRMRYYNSILSLGAQVGWYDKRNLVPFAEFFPVPGFVRSWLRMMSLPYSDFTRGSGHQQPLEAAGVAVAPTICYEDGYGSAQLGMLTEATVLANVTNDAWFGHSTARYQHLQIYRMRAIEAARFALRAANDGISAVIDPRGRIVAQAPQYQPAVLRAQIVPRAGLPPYARTGNWPVVLLATAMLLGASWRTLRRATRAAAT